MGKNKRKKTLLSLDLSTTTVGWAFFNQKTEELLEYGEFKSSTKGFAKLNKTHKKMCVMERLAADVLEKTEELNPDLIVVEQITQSRNRLGQKTLDGFHFCVQTALLPWVAEDRYCFIEVIDWRRILGLKLSKEDKKQNRKFRRRGSKSEIINWKTLSVRFVKNYFGILVKHDCADAISVGLAYLKRGV